MEVYFTNLSEDVKCWLRVSDEALTTSGLELISDMKADAYCLNPGYYLIGCESAGKIKVSFPKYPEQDKEHDLYETPFYKVLKLSIEREDWTTVPITHSKKDFDKSKPLTGEPAYPKDYTDEKDNYECNQKGYLQYLEKFPEHIKCTSRDPSTAEFHKRLEYFIDSCIKINDWNSHKTKYPMEFTFYADWHPDEFEEITTTKQRYSGIKTPVPSVNPIYNNSNLRYLMPSVDPCTSFKNPAEARRLEEVALPQYICKPQNCSVTWAFAVTNSIEYAIKKLYFEEYDQIVSVSLSAQELIDCVAKEHDLEGEACEGLPIAWGFDYIYENGIAYSQYYPHTNKEGDCAQIDDENKYHIDGYEKPSVYNKIGLFELVMRGPTAVTLGLDPEYFQYYGSDNVVGPYFDSVLTTNQWQASVHGVVVEYYQYESDGSDTIPNWPFFAIETRLRPCNSNVFRIPILETTDDDNIAGIAGYAIRPIVSEILATPEPTTPNHSSQD